MTDRFSISGTEPWLQALQER